MMLETMLDGNQTWFNIIQHRATWYNMVAKRMQHRENSYSLGGNFSFNRNNIQTAVTNRTKQRML